MSAKDQTPGIAHEPAVLEIDMLCEGSTGHALHQLATEARRGMSNFKAPGSGHRHLWQRVREADGAGCRATAGQASAQDITDRPSMPEISSNWTCLDRSSAAVCSSLQPRQVWPKACLAHKDQDQVIAIYKWTDGGCLETNSKTAAEISKDHRRCGQVQRA